MKKRKPKPRRKPMPTRPFKRKPRKWSELSDELYRLLKEAGLYE
jgi:hypothetical protein